MKAEELIVRSQANGDYSYM